ncbi:MAG TPA: helix-turn-helix domain-containing protein [Dehalococcoidales bacterium]|nr:helix-turn-helix domain-containing protein [Dehalococcoidales bacterium]
MEGNNNLLTPEQVAGILQLHVLTIYNYIRQGRINAVQIGRNYRITPEDLTHFIESNRIKNHRAKGRNIGGRA